MFEIGLAELALIALVALLVLGPEKLPRAARMAGLYVRKARATWFSIQADIERELAAEDMKQALKDTQKQMGVGEIEKALKDTERSLIQAPVPAPDLSEHDSDEIIDTGASNDDPSSRE